MMTRQIQPAGPVAVGERALLRPLQARNLADEVVERIADGIRKGRLAPGARLPTEQELVSALGVSRTVVREAVAALRADGLVTTRQGSGAFVAADASRVPFRIDPAGLRSIGDVLEVMELRLAIEVEAAALAADRITPARLGPIRQALRSIETALAKGGGAVKEDFAFHQAIALASGNTRIAELLELLGHHIIPRQSVRMSLAAPSNAQRLYLTRIQEEHDRIFEAIRSGNVKESRSAMRAHLTRSLARYRRLAEQRADTTDRRRKPAPATRGRR